ncbi:MAG: RHS repeat-associated core domain-containing protein, partial [Acidobacteriota bacterium]
TAIEGATWSQNYSYDQYGNRAVTGYIINAALTPQTLSAFNAATNRIIASLYDFSGNQTQDQGGRLFGYDAENHQTNFNSGVGTYSYDCDGRRVKKTDSTPGTGGTTVFVYDVATRLIAEYHSDPVPPPAGGGGTSYLTTDHLGSTRVVTDSTGAVKARYDYLPFGEEIPTDKRPVGIGYGGGDSTRQKFTQKERDGESGLDYFLARYYSSAQGRFTSVDPENAAAALTDPQSWNGYVYARNNPLFFVDPNGETYVVSGAEGSGTLIDEVFLSEKKYFEGQGFIFTGNGTFFESGNIISPDGKVIATYRQISIDDKLQRFAFEMSRHSDASLEAIHYIAEFNFLPIQLMLGSGMMRGGITTLGVLRLGTLGKFTLLLEKEIAASRAVSMVERYFAMERVMGKLGLKSLSADFTAEGIVIKSVKEITTIAPDGTITIVGRATGEVLKVIK